MKEKKEEKSNATSRRDFVKQGAMAAAAFTIVPRFVLGKGYRAPSDTLYIATLGLHGKGKDDTAKFTATGKAKIAFLCDVDQVAAAEVFNTYPTAKRYIDYREMFDKEHKNFDAVSVSTPDNTHALIASAAMQLGKHIWVQKPLTHDIYEARTLAILAKKYKVVSQMGNQGSSADGVRSMREWYEAGLIGDVQTVYTWTDRPVWPQGGMKWPDKTATVPSTLDWDLWQGPAKEKPFPASAKDGGIDLLPFNWRGWWAYGTGVIGDMGAHILEAPMTVLNLGHVEAVQSSQSQPGAGLKFEDVPDTCPASSYTILTFPKTERTPGPVKIHWMDGGLMPPRPEELEPTDIFLNTNGGGGGMIFVGTKGKIMADCYAGRPRLLPVSRMDETINIPQKYPRVKGGQEGHYGQWVEACLAGYGKMETSSPFEKAALVTENMLVANLAIRGYNVPKAPVAAPPVDANAAAGAAAPAAGRGGRGGGFGGRGGRKSYPARGLNLFWDSAAMKITNFDEVNQFVKREYRAPFTLSGV
jgi:predicted dehydrogenase